MDFANGELVTVTVFAAQVTDQDTDDPPRQHGGELCLQLHDRSGAISYGDNADQRRDERRQSIRTSRLLSAKPSTSLATGSRSSCATSGTRNVADTVVTGGPTTFTINPNADFANGEVCTVTVFAAQVTDQDSGDPPDNMAANFVFSFTTIDVAPTVTATTPTNGAINQATNTNITVTFSEPVNVTGNWFQIVCTDQRHAQRRRHGRDWWSNYFHHQSERRFRRRRNLHCHDRRGTGDRSG